MAARPRALPLAAAHASTPTAAVEPAERPFTAPLGHNSPNTARTAAPTPIAPLHFVQNPFMVDADALGDVEPAGEAGGLRALSAPAPKRPRDRTPAQRFQRPRRDDLGWMHSLEKRQWQLPHAQGYPNCNYQDNSVFTCYPESNTTLVQGDYSLVIWNAMQPSFISQGAVDVYLYNADTQDVATSWKNESNSQGMVGIVPDDPWWPGPQSADEWFGSQAANRTAPYFFVVVPAGQALTGGEVHGATFSAIQTAAPISLSAQLAAMTSSSLASASSSASSAQSARSASLASGSSASLSSQSGSGTGSASPSGSGRKGSLQNESSSSPRVPNWGIALIVIFGILALAAGTLAVFLCLGRARRRQRREEKERRLQATGTAAGSSVGRRSYYDEDALDGHGSADPILGLGGQGSMRGSAGTGLAPVLLGASTAGGSVRSAGGGGGGTLGVGGGRGGHRSDEDAGTLSTSDAARMAEAFRAALRKSPFNFGGAAGGGSGAGSGASPDADADADADADEPLKGATRPPGPSPTGADKGDDSVDSSGSGGDASVTALGPGRDLLVNELQGEGRSMKSVEGGGKRWGSQGSGGGRGGGGP